MNNSSSPTTSKLSYTPPQANHISGETFDRALGAPDDPSIFTEFLTGSKKVNKVRYGVNHFNAPWKGTLLFLNYALLGLPGAISSQCGKDWLEIGGESMIQKELELDNLCHLICHLLCTSNPPSELKVQVLRNSQHRDIVLTQLENNRVERKFLDEPAKIMEKMTLGEIRTTFENDRFNKLQKLAQELKASHTLPAMQLDKYPGIENVTKKTDSQTCLGNYPFVAIHAGTTRHTVSEKKEITDTATVVLHDGMLAATVVGGHGSNASQEVSQTSQTCSALVTAAALDTVKYAVQQLGMDESEVQKYFFSTLKLLDKDEILVGEKSHVQATFGGVVLYLDAQGNHSKFVYGLGNVGVAANGLEEEETWHLQKQIGKETSKSIEASDVTVKSASVNDDVTSIQLMTKGCAPILFDSASLQCKSLPKHGEFNSEELFELVNPETYKKAEKEWDNPDENHNKTELQQLNAQLQEKAGSDVLHLSVDVAAAFKVIDPNPQTVSFKEESQNHYQNSDTKTTDSAGDSKRFTNNVEGLIDEESV